MKQLNKNNKEKFSPQIDQKQKTPIKEERREGHNPASGFKFLGGQPKH